MVSDTFDDDFNLAAKQIFYLITKTKVTFNAMFKSALWKYPNCNVY